MSFWILIQVLINLLLLASTIFLWMKLNRPAKDDPRLSKGLQLLQSKISVLEDLSDRTDTQVNQLIALIEQKTKELQNHIFNSDKQIQKIDNSMGRSLEVAKIFQDKIPHQEIIERQNTIKYVKAATMAHQGATVEEIAKHVDLSMGEIEFIAKVNREELQFSYSDLPDWAREDLDFQPRQQVTQVLENQQVVPAKPQTSSEVSPLAQLGEQFRNALSQQQQLPPALDLKKQASPASQQSKTRVIDTEVKKVVFPKIDVSKNLG